MDKKVIYIIIGLLVVVLLFVIFKGKSGSGDSDTKGSGSEADGSSTDIVAMLDSMNDLTQPTQTNENCGTNCRRICKPLDDKLFGCGDRCQCKNECKSACAKGLDYKTMFP